MRPLGETPRRIEPQTRPPMPRLAGLVELFATGAAVVAGWRVFPRPVMNQESMIVEWNLLGHLTPVALALAAVLLVTRRHPGCWSHGRGVRMVAVAGVAFLSTVMLTQLFAWHAAGPLRRDAGWTMRRFSQWTSDAQAIRTERCWDRDRWLLVPFHDPERPPPSAILVRPRGRAIAEIEATTSYYLDQSDGRCRSAYHVEAGTWRMWDELGALSPFVLLREGELGSEDDVHRLEAALHRLRERHEYLLQVIAPDEAVLLAELDSENPWIREAAARLVVAGGAQRYPQASWVVRQRK